MNLEKTLDNKHENTLKAAFSSGVDRAMNNSHKQQLSQKQLLEELQKHSFKTATKVSSYSIAKMIKFP